MGDAIFALPLATACEAEQVEAEFYTAMPELLAGLKYVKGFKVPPYGSDENSKLVGTRLKYDRYRGSYFDSYYDAHGMKTLLISAQRLACERLCSFARPAPLSNVGYVVAGAPRLPARHKNKKTSGDEGNPYVYEGEIVNARREGWAVVAVGKDETYTAPLFADVDVTDKLSLSDLIFTVMHAEYVISQVSFLTALAGCLGVPVKYIPGCRELPEKHARHIEGVAWKKNLQPTEKGVH